MNRKRFTEQQILGPLKEADAGVPVKELCCKHGSSDAAFYGWRSKFRGLQISEAKRLRELEAENGKLKKLLAEAHLEVEALKVAFGVKR
jgi:putative transposase